MASEFFLCDTKDIPLDTCKGFALEKNSDEQTIFIANRDNHFYAYKNFCPHTGANLNWQPDIYLDLDNLYIQCSIHGARFEVESGYCVWGPCARQSLIRIAIEIRDEKIYLTETVWIKPTWKNQ